MKIFLRHLSVLSILAIVVGLFGPAFFAPLPARAAITATGPYDLLPSGGMTLPANSFDSSVFRFALTQSANETLSSVTITLVNNTGGTVPNATLASHIERLRVYNDSNGNNYFDAMMDSVAGTQTTANVGSATTITTSANNSLAASGAMATSFFVVLKTGASWAAGDSILVNIAANGIATSANSPTITAITGTKSISFYSGASSGAGFYIKEANYVNSTTVDVLFNDTLDTSSNATTSTLNYTLTTASGGDDSTVTSVTILPDNKSVRVSAASAVIVSTGTDTIQVNNQVLNCQGIPNSTTAVTAIFSDIQPLVISEVKVGSATDSSDEFIEIYNRSAAATSISSLKLHIVNAAGTSDTNATLTLVGGITNVASRGYMLIAPAGSPSVGSADATYSTSTAAQLVPAGAAYISYSAASSTAVLDRVCWGSHSRAADCEGASSVLLSSNDGTSIERKAVNSSTAGTMATGGSDASNGNGVDTDNNSYDFVARSTPGAQNAASGTETPSGGSWGGANNGAPNFQHAPVFRANSDSTLNLMARIYDDGGNIPSGNTQLIYCVTDTTCTPASSTPIYGVSVGSSWFKLSSTTTNLWSGGKQYFKYYLQASDSASPAKTSVYTNDPSYNDVSFNHDWNGIPSAALQQSKALTITLVSGNLGSANISGLVQDSSGNAIAGATAWIDGTQFVATTGNDGAFSFANVGPSGGTQIKVTKENYGDQSLSTYVPASGSVSLSTITLYSGTMGHGGDFNMPKVASSFPSMGMNNFPTQSPSGNPPTIDVTFNKAMDTTTIVDSDASDTGSYIYLTLAGNDTKIGGAVTALSSTQARFTPTANLTVGRGYTLFLTQGIKDTVGNPLTGNGAGGTYVLNFSTAGAMYSSVGEISNFGSANSFPPFVVGSQPSPGKINVARNTKAFVAFSEAMQNAASNLSNVKLYRVTGAYTASESKSLITTTNSLDTSNKIVILTPASTLDASSDYRVEVLGGIVSAKGVPLGNPSVSGYAAVIKYKSDFKTSSSSDSGAPTVSATIPADASTSASTLKPIVVSFSESINPTTITDTSVSLKLGSTAIDGDLTYDANSWTATFVPDYALTATSTYTISVTTDVQDLAGNALDQDSIVSGNQGLLRTFTTASADVSSPTVVSAQANDFALKVVFSKPMLAVPANDSNYTNSVLNPSNYTVRTVNSSGVQQSAVTLPAAATLAYDSTGRSISINGLPSITGFGAGSTLLNIVVSNVKDIAFNDISSANKSATTTAQSSSTTGNFSGGGGMMMPMTDSSGNMMQGAMFGPMSNEVKTFTDSGIGFIPTVRVFPFNSMAGASTIYGIEAPISQQVPASGFIDITFPEGTDITNAKKDAFSPPNSDLNGPGSGAVVFATNEGTLASGWTTGGQDSDGVTVNTNARVVRVILGSVATRCGTGNTSPCTDDTHDFLRLDIAQVVNPTIAKSVGTSGNSATVETKNSNGTVIETLSSGSFFTTQSGSFTVRGRVLSGATGLNGVNVFLMSPMAGPQSSSTASSRFGGNTGEFMFQNLVAGSYMLGTEKFFKIGATEYTASFPMPVNVSSANCASNICSQNISVTDASVGATVTLSISGTFSNNAIDIFASGPGAFRMVTSTLDGTLTNNTSNSVKLNANGVWMVGFGPGMSMEIFGKKGPSAPTTWLVPRPQQVLVTGCPNSCTANPITLSFNISAANKTIKFTVKDTSSNAIGFAHVFAYSPVGGIGSDTNTSADGTGSMTLAYGTYKIGADVAGMPPGIERSITIRSVSGADQVFIDGSATGVTLSTMTASSLILTISKPSYTITGKVTDGTNPIANTPVSAYRTNGPGHAETFTNSSGDYTLYVNNGTWKVQAFLSDYGKLPEKTITVSSASVSGQNFEPDTASTNYATFTKSVAVDTDADGSYSAANDEELSNIQIIVEGTTSAGEAYVNTALSDTNGSSTFKLPPGSYTMKAWSPSLGQLPAYSSGITVNSSGTVTEEPANLLAPQTGTVIIKILDFNGNATSTASSVMEFSQIGGKTDKIEAFGNVASSTISLPVYDISTNNNVTLGQATSTSPSNFYLVRVAIPGISQDSINVYGDSGTIMATSSVINAWKVEVDGNETINVRLPDIKYANGTVKDASGSAIPGAVVHLENTSTGDTVEVQADSSGNYSTKLSAGTYLMSADKDGYIDTASAVTVNSSGAIADSATTMTVADLTISGTITAAGTAVSGATVRAEKLGGGIVTAASASDGTYTLRVVSGDWKVSASYDGYTETSYGNVVSLSSSNATGVSINLTTTNTSLAGSSSLSMTPQTGGSLSDTTANLSINAPEAAIASSADSYTLHEKETSNIVGGGGGTPISNEAKTVTGYDNEGGAVSLLNSDVSVTASYTKTDIAASFDSLTLAKADKVKMASWDDTADDWQHLPTTVAYKNSSGNFVEPQSDLSNVSTMAYSGQTTHFSVFNPIKGSDNLAPSAPTGITVSSGNAGVITISWTAPITNSDGTTLTDLLGYELYRSTSANGTFTQVNTSDITGTTYTNSGLTAGTTYYYKVTAADTGGLESAMSSVSSGVIPAAAATSGSGGGGGAVITQTPVSVAPSNISVSIQNGATETSDKSVTLTLGATDASHMMISEDSNFSGAAWETYKTSKPIILSDGYGEKKVYVKFKSSSDKESSVISDTINLVAKAVTSTINRYIGGSVSLGDKSVSVSFQGEAVSGGDPAVTISPTSVYTAFGGKSLAGAQVYDVKAVVAGKTVTQFNNDVELSFAYTDSQIKDIAESTLSVYYWDDTNQKWVKLGGTVDKTNKKVSVKTPHFTIFALFGEPAVSMAGKLVKLKCDNANQSICSAVYFIGNNGKRYVFPNDKIYLSWYADWNSIEEVLASKLAGYTIGGNVNYKPGVRMVKIVSDPKVYAVSKNGGLRWVKTESLAKGLYGDKWNKTIDDLNDAFFFSYKVGNPIEHSTDYSIENAKVGSPDINTDKDL